MTTLPLHTQGRVIDFMNTVPAFYEPLFYYVESNQTGPAGIDFDDYTSPHAPVHHEDVVVLDGMVKCMTMNSEYLYLVFDDGTYSYLQIYDYTPDPANPVLVDQYKLIDRYQIKIGLMDAEGPSTALVTINPQNLVVYDIEDPHNIVFIDSSFMPDHFWNEDFDVWNEYIVKTYFDVDDLSGHLQVLKLDPVSGLENWGGLDLDGWGVCVATRDYYAYVENTGQGITCVDYSSQFDLQVKGSVYPIGPVSDLDIRFNYLCSAEGAAGPAIYDTSDPSNIVLSKRAKCINRPLDGVIEDEYAYFIDGSWGYGALKVLRISGPETFIVWEECLLGTEPTCMARFGNMILVGSLDGDRVWLFDTTDQYDKPVLVYSKLYASKVTSVEITQTAGYIALLDGTIKLLDVSDFPTVTEAPDGYFPYELYNLRHRGNYLYGTDQNMVRIFDVATPLDPSYVGFYSYGAAYEIRDMEFQGYYLYLCTTDTLQIADFFNPFDPVTFGLWLPSPGLPRFAVQGSYAYVTNGLANPVVVTLYPPSYPTIFGEPFGELAPFLVNNVAVHNDRLCLMQDVVGLRIFDIY